MHNTIFIFLQGGVIQEITATNDLIEANVVVVDHDVDGVEDFKLSQIGNDQVILYKHPVGPIDDGDVEILKEMMEE